VTLRTAAARGALAFGAVALAGQAVALAVWAGGGPGSVALTPRIGWLYTCSFLGIPLHLASGELSGRVSFALLAGTAILVWVAWRPEVPDTRNLRERVLSALVVGTVVGALSLVASLVVDLAGITVPVPRNPILGDVEVRPDLLAAFAVPTLIAGTAASMGALTASGNGDERIRAIVSGGVRAFIVGLFGALGFALLLTATRPDATAAYVRAVTAPSGGVTAAAVGHHVLVVPNQSVWLLAAGVGACDRIVSDRVDIVVVCPGTIPDAISLDLITPGVGAEPATRAAPWEFLALPLIPLAATFAGGVRAAQLAPGGSPIAAGAGAGIVFAALFASSAWLAGITLGGRLLAGDDGVVRYGPDPWVSLVLGAVWGVVGGIAGALAARR
jgi:hypothetical protein